MKAFVRGISYYLPEYELTNEMMSQMHPEWSVEKIQSKTGIFSRHIAAADECCSDMALKVGEKILSQMNVQPAEVDFILLCTQSPDYFLPTTACILQDKLGIPKSCGALDFNLGCSGYVYGLALAKGLIFSSVATNILLITSETYSKYIHPDDKSNKTIFGDGASATLIGSTGIGEIKEFSLGTDGSGAENLIVREGACRFPTRSYKEQEDILGNTTDPGCLYMNGPEILSFTSTTVPALVNEVLEKNNCKLEDIDLFIFHQANQFLLEHLRKKLKIPQEKFFTHLKHCGNTVSSTIPIALKEAIAEGKIEQGFKCLIAGFGVGYSWGGTVLQF